MNLWDVGGAVVALDLAHNEDSLVALLSVVAGLRLPGASVVTVLGCAGDRLDEQLREMGHLAAHGSDRVVIAEKPRYLRGRDPVEMVGLFRAGAGEDLPSYPSEVAGLAAALATVGPGDVVALMCHEDRPGCEAVLLDAGGVRMTAADVRARVLAARD